MLLSRILVVQISHKVQLEQPVLLLLVFHQIKVLGQQDYNKAKDPIKNHQINLAVNQLDQMTQQNAALVEQSAAAASSLRGQADQLRTLVNVFRLDHHLAQGA